MFNTCRSCWHGQAYCSQECQTKARLKQCREAQARFRNTAAGREAHAELERERRRKKKEGITPSEQTESRDTYKKNVSCVANQGSIPPQTSVTLENRVDFMEFESSFQPGHIGMCQFCGKVGTIVSQFERRGY